MKRRGPGGRGSRQGRCPGARDPVGRVGLLPTESPALRTQGPVGWSLRRSSPVTEPRDRPGEGRRARAGGASGPGAFQRIGLLAQAPAPPLQPRFRPRLEREQQSPPSCSAGVCPVSRSPGEGPAPALWLFPVSQDHFTGEETDAPPAPFSTRMTPGRACFTTGDPVDCSLRL